MSSFINKLFFPSYFPTAWHLLSLIPFTILSWKEKFKMSTYLEKEIMHTSDAHDKTQCNSVDCLWAVLTVWHPYITDAKAKINLGSCSFICSISQLKRGLILLFLASLLFSASAITVSYVWNFCQLKALGMHLCILKHSLRCFSRSNSKG